jgi:glyoxylase-like metal-dependent hydrolase (beta-lactamase superfamily II)
MKLFIHYCSYGFSNCYLLGAGSQETPLPGEAPPPSEAILIDPGGMDEQILGLIEENECKLLGIFITHDHISHVRGLRTLKRIYDADIYAVNHVIREHKTILVRDGDTVSLGNFTVAVISVPGHSSDSAVFKIGSMLFTGDTLSAGLVGRTASSYGAAIQLNALRSKILSLPGDFTVFPGHGPPTSLEIERRYNAGILFYDEQKKRRPSFKIDY